jgi:hypothetical protein
VFQILKNRGIVLDWVGGDDGEAFQDYNLEIVNKLYSFLIFLDKNTPLTKFLTTFLKDNLNVFWKILE